MPGGNLGRSGGEQRSVSDVKKINRDRSILQSPPAVGELAIASAASALLAAAELARARGRTEPLLALDAAHVEASFTSERHVLVGGRPLGSGFAPLSTWLRTADGWPRWHGNYPHHRAALLAALRTSADLDAVRAAAGVKVLDLTRVIAGPVATRTLAALEAQVLRIDAPDAVELDLHSLHTGPGKRSARRDLRSGSGARVFHSLLAQADVVVQGYRTGSLRGARIRRSRAHQPLSAARHGHPVGVGRAGSVGEAGEIRQPRAGGHRHCRGWPARWCADPGRIAGTGARPRDRPPDRRRGPARARRAHPRGGPLHARLALARTAGWLLALPAPEPAAAASAPEPAPFLIELPLRAGPATLVTPPGALDGRPLRWTRGPEPIGSSPAKFAPAHSP